MIEMSKLCAANYPYKRYSLEYFLNSAERLGFKSLELWASGPHLHLEDFNHIRLNEVKRQIINHHLKLVCLTPEQCVYAISVSHPDKIYRDRSIEFFNQHIEAASLLDCDRMVVSTGCAYLDGNSEDEFGYCVEAFQRICSKAEREGIQLVCEPLTKFTTHICHESRQLIRLMKEVGSPMLKALADTDIIAATGLESFACFARALGHDLQHVHFVDGNPGGHLVPGDGNLDLKGMLKTLSDMAYQGYLALEILDRQYVMEPEKAMRRALDWFEDHNGNGDCA